MFTLTDTPLTGSGNRGSIVLREEREKPGTLDNSRPLDVHKWSEHPSVNHAVGAILAEILTLNSPQTQALDLGIPRRRQRFHNHIKIVVLDLVIAWSAAAEENDLRSVLGRPFVAYSRDKNSYSSGSRYAALHIKYPYILAVIDALCALGYVEHKKGFQDRRTGIGRQSRMRATMKMMELTIQHRISPQLILRRHPLIVLRDPKGANIDVSGMATAQRLTPAVERINEMLADADVCLHLTREQRVDLYRRCHVDLTRIAVHRVFNADFRHGGRYYGHWIQSIPKEFRNHLTIRGVPVIELDFSSMHPRLLYANEGLVAPQGDLYALEGFDLFYRRAIKVVFNTLINATNERAAVNSVYYGQKGEISLAQEFNLSMRKVLEMVSAIKTEHYAIAHHIGSGAGLRLQCQDSGIAKDIMLTLWTRGIHSLPLHDSFLVAAPHAKLLLQTMREVSAQQLNGTELPVDIKRGKEHLAEEDLFALRAP